MEHHASRLLFVNRLTCEGIREQSAEYVRGTLSLRATQRVSTHLARCVGCRAAADGQRVALRQQRVESWSLTLPAGVAATIGAALVCLRLVHPVTPHAPTPAPQPIQPRPAAAARFIAQPSVAYHVRLHVSDREEAQELIAKIVATSREVQADGPYAGRYYLTAEAEPITRVIGRLTKVGDPGIAAVGRYRWWVDKPPLADGCAVTLDLVPREPAQGP